MALLAGSVTVSPDGSHVGSGMANALYEAKVAGFLADQAALESALGDAGVEEEAIAEVVLGYLQAFAKDANANAAATIAYVTANAVTSVTVTTGTAGLQRMPASTAENTATKAPAAPVILTGGVT